MGSLGAPELLIILAIVLLLFGSTRLPKMARSLGQASKEFKKGVDRGTEEDDDGDAAAAKPAAASADAKSAKSDTSDKDETDTPAAAIADQSAAKPAEEAAGEPKG